MAKLRHDFADAFDGLVYLAYAYSSEFASVTTKVSFPQNLGVT